MGDHCLDEGTDYGYSIGQPCIFLRLMKAGLHVESNYLQCSIQLCLVVEPYQVQFGMLSFEVWRSIPCLRVGTYTMYVSIVMSHPFVVFVVVSCDSHVLLVAVACMHML